MENNQTELKPEQVLQMHFPLMDDEGSNFKRFYFNDAVAAMQEYADLRTAELQAEKAELLEALKWTTAGLDAAVNHTKRIYKRQSISTTRDGSRKSKPISAILSDAEALLSKHTK